MRVQFVLLLYAAWTAAQHNGGTKFRKYSRCPGFCGRLESRIANSSVYGSCQACPWGSRSFRGGACVECQDDLPLYDWFYLLFVAILPLLSHCFFVHIHAKRKSSRLSEALEYLCCVLECCIGGIAALLSTTPKGSFQLKGCGKSALREWYPAFYNPQVNFSKTLPCTYEVVFPLYSLPFVYFLYTLIAVVFLRSILYLTVRRKDRSSPAYYGALYCLPLLGLIHALFAGVLYYTFAYVLVIWSVAANAIHLALEGRKNLSDLLCNLFSSRHLTLLLVNMSLFAFAIVSLAVDKDDNWAFLALLLVPVPPIFYLLTIGLSHPNSVHVT